MPRIGDLRHVLAVRPSEFAGWTERFVVACQYLVDGDPGAAKSAIGEYNGLAVTHWYHFSAQNAGYDRIVLLGKVTKTSMERPAVGLSADRMPSAELTNRIYARDHFRCRYCHSPVLPPRVLKAVSGDLGTDLTKRRTNLETHGAQWLHCATIDHIEPHASGGDSAFNNLVTSCKACQFGKGKYSLKDLELELRAPAPDLRIRNRSWIETVDRLANRSA